MKLKYKKQIVDMLYDEWDLGKKNSKAKGKTCAWIYLFEILSEVEKITLKKENDKVIGICGYTKFNSNKYKIRKKWYEILKNVLIYSPLIKNKQEMHKYYDNYDYIPKELENYFDGEITILIVDKSYRGKNIGKKLLMEIFELARKNNINKIEILSDESCNYEFYEKLGCKKIFEKVILNSAPDKCGNTSSEIGFIYEKDLGVE